MSSAVERFQKWFISQGGFLHPAVELVYGAEKGISLFVKNDEAFEVPSPGTILASCPHELSLSSLNAFKDVSPLFSMHGTHGQISELPSDVLRDAGPRFIAAILLCVEYLRGEQSFWANYIDILPGPPILDAGESSRRGLGEVGGPIWWTEEELKCLEGTNIPRGVDDLIANWGKLWQKWGGMISTWAKGNALNGLDWPLFKWAMTIFGSRSFSAYVLRGVTRKVDGKQVLDVHDPHSLLYPGIDLLNHSPYTANRWDNSANIVDNETRGPHSAGPSPFNGNYSNYFSIVANDELERGREVWNTYGPQTNSQLLLSWGFCIENNKDDRFALRLLANAPVPLLESVISAHEKDYQTSQPSSASKNNTKVAADITAPVTAGEDKILAYDLENDVYLVRSLSANMKDEEDYAPTTDAKFVHLSGFPEILLTKLSAQISNPRERADILSKPINFPPALLYQHMGQRNLLALTDLLLKKLQLTLSAFSVHTTSVDPRTMSSRGARRLQTAEIYKAGQTHILETNMERLRRHMQMALQIDRATLSRHYLPELSTLPTLLTYMQTAYPTILGDFTAGFAIENRNNNGSINNDDVAGVMAAIQEQSAEEIFITLVLGAMGIISANEGVNIGAQVQNIIPSSITALFDIYRTRGSTSLSNIAAEDLTDHCDAVGQYVSAMRDTCALSQSSLWNSTMWDNEDFVRSCVAITMEETLECGDGALALFTGDTS